MQFLFVKFYLVKKSEDVKIDDDFAKNLGASDLKNLKELISKQINEEYKNSLDTLSNKEILEQINKIKVNEIPQNLVDQEIKILSQGMKDEDKKKNLKSHESQAKKRIQAGLILNQFGEEKKISVTEQEMQGEIQKQLRMMPGQEKMLQEYYQSNPSILANLRGSLYEEKILKEIKKNAKPNKKEISKDEAEKLLKAENEKHMKDHHHDDEKKEKNNKKSEKKVKKTKKTKKVSKK
jgi:FKBP-type peptidyl-prolyl cis-trans isomerase (trigger factor)